MAAGGGRALRRGTRRAAAALLVATVVVTAVGCSDDGGDDAPERAADPVEVPDEPVDGGRIRLGLDGPLVVDPAEVSLASASQLMVLDLLHDGLARLSPDGTPQPALAASWKPGSGRARWDFTLDPDASFSDGTPITAPDVVASLEHLAAAGDASLAALRLEHVKGFRAFVDGTAEHLEGLTAPNDEIVRFTLDTPIAVMPQLLASPVYGVLHPDALAGGDVDDVPLSGAWQVDSSDADGVVLERRSDAGHLDEVELRTFDEPAGAYEAFEAGEVDWAPVPPGSHDEAVERYGDEHFAPFHAELYFGMNVRADSLLSNRRLRQAIAAAVDREAIVDEVYGDLADPLGSIVPAGVTGHSEQPCASCGHDPERAAEIVEEAFPDGEVPEVQIDFDESDPQRAMAEMVADDLEAAGIPTALRPRPLDEYESFVVSGEQELFSFGWIGVYASPDAYLSSQLLSSSADNLTGLASDEIDQALLDARASGVPSERADLWSSVERQALEAAVLVPIAQFRTQVVVAPRVQALAHAVDGTVDWSAVWLADAG